MTDYKSTIHLPVTNFPMKANLASREPEMLAHWQASKLYERLRHLRADAEQFVLHDGPPYANGNIHIGHAVNKIIKDIIVKSKSMSGFNAAYVPGWDCHGLPIELNVEKKIGKPGHKVDAKTFRQACRDYATSQIALQKTSFQRLGVLGDWQRPYETMQFAYEAEIVRSLGKILRNGYVHKGFRPIYWCLDCGSALAEAEVEYQDKTSDAIYVAFEVVAKDRQKILSAFAEQDEDPVRPIWVPIWTTTPWTLPANEAVCLHPEEAYVLVQTKQNYFLINKNLVRSCLEKFALADEAKIANQTLSGKTFSGIALTHPYLTDKQVPIIVGEHVTTDTGTGAVHTAPAHGVEDFQVGTIYHLPVENPVLANGCFQDNTPHLAGVHVHKANAMVIDLLKAQKKLLHHEKIEHSFPHCWRHKTPLIFRATPQWFIRMDQTKTASNGDSDADPVTTEQTLRKKVLAQIDQVTWLPDWGKARIQGMVLASPDWCISRQRAWGVPITFFVHKQSGQIHPNMATLLERIAEQIAQQGVEAWFDLNPQQWLGDEANDYEKITDVLDVWFDAGVSHAAVLSSGIWPELHFPADLYFEGSDQHRGWFQSALRTSVAMRGVAPFKTVLTHGFTVDAQGRKMSKSLGNVIEPEKIVSSLGADILRLWVASTDYRNEMSVSDDVLKRAADAYRRIRNTARYLLSSLHQFDPKKDCLPGSQWIALDTWIVKQSQILQEKIRKHYDQYEFHLIYHEIHNFCVNQLGSLYLDIIKDRQYTGKEKSIARQSAQTAMMHVLQALVRWLAPILSFTAEEIWHYMPNIKEDSVFLTTWYEDFPTHSEQNISEQVWQNLFALRTAVNKELEAARSSGLIGAGLEAKVIIYDPSNALQSIVSLFGEELKFFFITSGVEVRACALPEALMPYEISCDQSNIPIAVEVAPLAEDIKCVRCWHRCDSVGSNKEHPELCTRCVSNAFGAGESRQFF